MERLVADNGLKGLRLALEFERKELSNFKHFAPWDAQRTGGKFHQEFVDYSPVAIGLYAAAAGIPEPVILGVQDIFAAGHSNFDQKNPDQTKPGQKYPDYNWLYRSILNENVKNTDIGYDLYHSGRIKSR
jgi:hypothetical protein